LGKVLVSHFTKLFNSNYKYITEILLNQQNMKYEAAVNILFKCHILASDTHVSRQHMTGSV